MGWVEVLTAQAEDLLSTKFDSRDGNVVPGTSNVTLADGAVKIEAAFLYADLVGSSLLAKHCPWDTTAKILRTYLACSTRLIREYGGEIRSFDGDRVMGIFKGDNKEATAVRCAREIFWVVENIINPKAKAKFKSVSDNQINIRNCIGIDTGSAVAVRAGIRDNNDLIWIGRSPNLAAKLSDLREYPYSVIISSLVHYRLPATAKVAGEKNIWEQRSYKYSDENVTVYRTNYMFKP